MINDRYVNPTPIPKPIQKSVCGGSIPPGYAGPSLKHKIGMIAHTDHTVSPSNISPPSHQPLLWGQQLANGKTAAYNTQNASLITFLDDLDTFLNQDVLGLPAWLWIAIGVTIAGVLMIWLAL